MVFRKNSTSNEKEKILIRKNNGGEPKSFPFSYGIYELRELNINLENISPEKTKTDNFAKEFTMKSFMTIDTNENEPLKLLKNFSLSVVSKDLPKLIKLKEFILVEKSFNIGGIDKSF